MKTREEWQALAETLEFRDQAFIDGRFQPALSNETFRCVSPATESELTHIASCDADDIEIAVSSAVDAFNRGVWSERAPRERKQVLLTLADLIERHQEEFALLDSLDMGKPVADMLSIDLPDSIDCFRWTAECIDKMYGEIAPTGSDALALVHREPVGVVGAITPWNYPLMMAAWKVAPALAAGNSVVLKPSEKSSLSALRLAELAAEAGIPDGVFNVVPGSGATAGKALALHHGVDALAFTGSSAVAGMLMQYAGQSNMKRIWAEAGGKSPNLIFADCDDIDAAATNAAAAIFSNQGEVCIACSRVYVDRSIKDDFIKKLLAATARFKTGDPLDPATTMGPLVDREQLARVEHHVRLAIKEGGAVLAGGVPEYIQGTGFYAQPTIIGSASNQMTCVQEEIFGPVLAVGEFNTEDEAIALANDSKYGLGASIWTGSLSRAHRVSRKLRTGMVWINTWGAGDTTVPFGGVKASGNGRDKSLHALEKYSELKTVWISI